MLLFLAILCLSLSPPSAAAPPRDSTFSGSTRNKLLLISFDGFRWDYDRDVDTPNLDKMALDGVKAEYVTPPFLTITSPSHFTMLTGRHVENHGVIHNIWFNTTTQEKKQYYQTQFVDSYWDNGSLPIWITAQRQGLKAGSLHFPGTAAEYRGDIVRVQQVEPPFYNHANETDWRLNIDKVIGDWFHKQDLDFVSLYFGEPDLAGHEFGPDSPECRDMVRQVDRTVGYIRDKVETQGLTDKLNIIITADHGMAKILHGAAVEKIILSKIPGFSFKDIQFQLLDYGPVGMLLPKEGKLETVYQALKGGHPHLHVYKKEEMPERLHYSKHPRLLPLILIADPGYVVNGFLPLNSNKGEHGFDNEVMDMKSIFRAVGPDFHINKLVGPFDMVDVYPLMCHLLQINPEINDGHLKNTELMLVSNEDSGGEDDGSNGNKLLLISFDGFRWDYDRDVDTPNLDKMALDGVKAEYVTPPFLTITSPSHFTMLTGRHVENHGVIHNIWFNTTTQEKKQYYQTQFVDSYWDNGSLPIWITAQRQGLKAGSLHFPGTAAEYRGDIVRVQQVEPPFYNHANETDWRLNIDKVIGDWFHKQDLDFVSLYFGEPDLAGHEFGPDSPECRDMVRQVDRTVGYIRDKVETQGLTDKLNIIITADHGMAKILHGAAVEKIILSKIPGFSFKDIQFQLLDYGPVGMLLPKEGKLETVYQALKGGHPHLHVYKKEEMPERLHYSKHPRLLPLILIADPGYVVNGFLPLNSNKGEHGFDNEVMDMKSIFRAVGPDFHINKLVGPFDMVDVYPLMCHLLQINPEINDGHLKNTELMLVSKDDSGGEDDEPQDYYKNVMIGLSAVVGFLVLVFIVMVTCIMCKRSRKQKSEVMNLSKL